MPRRALVNGWTCRPEYTLSAVKCVDKIQTWLKSFTHSGFAGISGASVGPSDVDTLSVLPANLSSTRAFLRSHSLAPGLRWNRMSLAFHESIRLRPASQRVTVRGATPSFAATSSWVYPEPARSCRNSSAVMPTTLTWLTVSGFCDTSILVSTDFAALSEVGSGGWSRDDSKAAVRCRIASNSSRLSGTSATSVSAPGGRDHPAPDGTKLGYVWAGTNGPYHNRGDRGKSHKSSDSGPVGHNPENGSSHDLGDSAPATFIPTVGTQRDAEQVSHLKLCHTEPAPDGEQLGSRHGAGRIARGLLACILFVLVASSVAAGEPGPLRAAMYDTAWIAGAGALDLASTRYALSRCPACYESNPLMRTDAKMVLVKAGATAGAGWICYRMRKSGHPRAAKVFRWMAVGVWSGLAVNNMVRARSGF